MSTEKGLKAERATHYVLFVVMSAIIVAALWFGYDATVRQKDVHNENLVGALNEKPPAKDLPDFVIDKVKPNELELLKP